MASSQPPATAHAPRVRAVVERRHRQPRSPAVTFAHEPVQCGPLRRSSAEQHRARDVFAEHFAQPTLAGELVDHVRVPDLGAEQRRDADALHEVAELHRFTFLFLMWLLSKSIFCAWKRWKSSCSSPPFFDACTIPSPASAVFCDVSPSICLAPSICSRS